MPLTRGGSEAWVQNATLRWTRDRFSVINFDNSNEPPLQHFAHASRVHALDLMCVKTKHGEVMEREEVHDLVGDEEDFMALMPDGTILVRPVARGYIQSR
ncbi:hypothetical protein BSKO_11936 [Bryopsis sp. KO-2023]|nr:hypothetical protein BSKO_02011 [Bryopsis sp. KO-2023]GMH34996.1 hypothetical protein BSKO_02857 [Bryopsis sp. KO-2023]GMH40861.1 hypothetical protein BSKO_08765 [Bryopsis sp. KO-2023]GMH44002.1 hypothetical protein BSKO_11936 [Bryopsis sp. KO-2023]